MDARAVTGLEQIVVAATSPVGEVSGAARRVHYTQGVTLEEFGRP